MTFAFLISYISTGVGNLLAFNYVLKKHKDEFMNGKYDFNEKELLKLFIIDLIPVINMIYGLYLGVNALNNDMFMIDKFATLNEDYAKNINNGNKKEDDDKDTYNELTLSSSYTQVPHKTLKRTKKVG